MEKKSRLIAIKWTNNRVVIQIVIMSQWYKKVGNFYRFIAFFVKAFHFVLQH